MNKKAKKPAPEQPKVAKKAELPAPGNWFDMMNKTAPAPKKKATKKGK